MKEQRAIHICRNAHGFSANEIREARLEVCNRLEQYKFDLGKLKTANIDTEKLKHDREYWDKCDPTGGGATHYWPDTGDWYRRCINTGIQVWALESWMQAINGDRTSKSEAITRPLTERMKSVLDEHSDAQRHAPEWSGEGRAPVGWKGEVNNGGKSDYFRCEVVAHHYKTGREILKTENSSMGILTEKPDCWIFRATAERDELNQIIDAAMRSGDGDAAAAILAAGWHK